MSTISKQITLQDGRVVKFRHFQAAEIIKINKAADEEGYKSASDLPFFMATKLATIDDIPLSMDVLDSLPMAEGLKIVGSLSAEVTDQTTDSHGVIFGVLPSGKAVTIRPFTTGDFRKAGTRHGEAMRAFSMIEIACTIDAKPVDFVDAQMMDGLDFLAIQAIIGADPS
jgi:hypothetical protein